MDGWSPIPSFNRRDLLRLIALSPLALPFAGGRSAFASPDGAPLPPEPGAGGWQTWLVPSIQGTRPSAPMEPSSARALIELRELLDLQARRNDNTAALVEFWDLQGGLPRWSNILLEKIKETRTNPVRASRALALFHTAIADAAICVWDAKFAYRRLQPAQSGSELKPIVAVDETLPSYPSEHAAIAAAAATLLSYLYPAQTALVHGQRMTFDTLANEAALSRLWAGANYRSDLEAGIRMGQAVAWLAIARGQSDGSSAVWDAQTQPGRLGGTPPSPEGTAPYWTPTAPANAFPPLEPLAGYWNPWLLESPSQFRAPAPPGLQGSFPSELFLKETMEMKEAVASFGHYPERLQIARFWADNPGESYTPPGHWAQITADQAVAAGLSTPRAARAMALVAAGLADSAIACWDTKYHYWLMRPITPIRTMADQPFYDPTWLSPIPTPPFPAYTSGHSTFSGCTAAVLESLFPGAKIVDALGQSVGFNTAAEQAMMSRLYGGIHYHSDNEEGLICGRRIAELVLRRAQNDGA
jgi:membrane-associated phospholipid phosphatase